MANQYGSKSFDKVTLTLDPNDPLTLQYLKSIESKLRSTIRSAQDEGEPIRRTPRTLDESGMMRTDFYVPQGVGSTIQNVYHDVEQGIRGRHERGLAGRMSVSEGVQMRTQTAMINDKAARARIARTVQERGGMARTTEAGMTHLEIPLDAQILGTEGKPVPLARSVSAQISAANRKAAANMTSFLSGSGYGDMSAVEAQQAAKMAAGKLSMKDMIYARQIKKRGEADILKQYEADHPDDPRVIAKRKRLQQAKARSARASKAKTSKAVHGGIGIVSRMIMGAITAIVGGVSAGVGILKGIKELVTGLGETLRGQRMADMRFNFSEATTTNWERVAKVKGLKEGTLGAAAARLQSAWADPIHLKEGEFAKIAPYFKDKTKMFADFAVKGGEGNILELLGGTLDVAMQSILKGEYLGEKMSQGAAAKGWIGVIGESFGPEAASILQAMYADYRSEARSGPWTEKDASGNDVVMTGLKYLTMGEWMPRFMKLTTEGLGLANSTDRALFETARQEVQSFSTFLKSVGEDAVTKFSGKIIDATNALENNFINFLVKLFPEKMAGVAMSQTKSALSVNDKTNKFLLSTDAIYEGDAQIAVRSLNTNRDFGEVIASLRKGKTEGLNMSNLSSSSAAAIGAYIAALEAKEGIAAASQQYAAGEVPKEVLFDADVAAQAGEAFAHKISVIKRKGAYKMVETARKKLPGTGYFNYQAGREDAALTAYQFFTQGFWGADRALDNIDEQAEKMYLSRGFKKASAGDQKAIQTYFNKLKLLILAATPGREEDVAALMDETADAISRGNGPEYMRQSVKSAAMGELRKFIDAAGYANIGFDELAKNNKEINDAQASVQARAETDTLLRERPQTIRHAKRDIDGNLVRDAKGRLIYENRVLPYSDRWVAEGNRVLFDVDEKSGNSVVYIKFQQLDEKGAVLIEKVVGQLSGDGRFSGDTVVDINGARSLNGRVNTE